MICICLYTPVFSYLSFLLWPVFLYCLFVVFSFTFSFVLCHTPLFSVFFIIVYKLYFAMSTISLLFALFFPYSAFFLCHDQGREKDKISKSLITEISPIDTRDLLSDLLLLNFFCLHFLLCFSPYTVLLWLLVLFYCEGRPKM
jgi:hypothetical protein